MMDAPGTYLASSRLVANIQSDNFLASVLGSAINIATVPVNHKPTVRHGDSYRAELNPDNPVNPVHLSVTNVAVLILRVRLLPPGAWQETGMRSARELIRIFAGRGFCGMLKWPQARNHKRASRWANRSNCCW